MMDLSKKLELVSHSDIGRCRSHNEDSSAIEASLGLLIIADGMGGYRAGEVASAIAISSIVNYIRLRVSKLKPQEKDPETGLSMASVLARDAIHEANNQIYLASKEHAEFKGMGTTALVVFLYDDHFSVAHVGDSRLYRQRDRRLEKITNDHSLVQELVDRGLYSQSEAELKTPKNLVTRAMGVNETVSVDVYEDSVLPDDLFLLCTDGLSDMVTDKKIEQTLIDYETNLNQAALALIDLANLHGGKDNISVVLGRTMAEFPASSNWFSKLLGTK